MTRTNGQIQEYTAVVRRDIKSFTPVIGQNEDIAQGSFLGAFLIHAVTQNFRSENTLRSLYKSNHSLNLQALTHRQIFRRIISKILCIFWECNSGVTSNFIKCLVRLNRQSGQMTAKGAYRVHRL